jgi:hypothetical protein
MKQPKLINSATSNRSSFIACLLAVSLMPCALQAADLVKWDFFGESSPATSTADVINSNLRNSGTLARGPGAASSSGSNSFRTVGFLNNGIATTNTDYFQTTLRAATGYSLSLSAIDAKFVGTASFAATPGVNSQFAYSLDGTNFTLIGSPQATIGTPATLTQISLTEITQLQGVPDTTTVTIRYYASGQTSTGGWGFSSATSGTFGLAITGELSAGADTTAPTLASTVPLDGATDLLPTANLIATFSETVQKGTGNIVIKKSSDNSVVDTIDVTTSQVTIVGATVTIDPSVTLPPTEACYVQIDATAIKDNAGTPNFFAGISDTSTWNFTVVSSDTTSPTITLLSPLDEATEVALTANLVATFSESILKGTGNILIKKISDNSTVETIDVTSSLATVSGNTLTIDPTAPLDGATAYYVEIDATAIKDLADTPNFFAGITGNSAWNFTSFTPDTTAPAITAVAPADNIIGMSPTANLTVTYNETVQKGTGFITIKKTSDDSTVEAIDVTTAAVTVASTLVTIDPSVTLDASTEYYVLIDATAIRDVAAAPNNNAGITSTTAWSFKTFTPGDIVMSQIYGGGGNSGAQYKNDFVELHNNTAQSITLFGWSVQYASSTGLFTNISTIPTATIPSGGYYLIQQGGGATGANLPTVDATGTLNFSATNGKVALVADITGVSGSTSTLLSDFVGFGTANDFETAAAAAGSNTTSLLRLSQGTADTNNNGADFITGTPAPRNSSTAAFNPVIDGSGSVTLVNATPSSPLINQPVFAANTAQSVSINIAGTLATSTIAQVSITVPNAFGAPLLANISVSGTGLNGASPSVSGQTITLNRAAITTTNNVVVTIAGLTTPDTSAALTIDGNYSFTVSTASSSGSLTAISPASTAYVVIPIANVRDQDANGVPLDLNKKVAIQGICTEGNFNASTQTSGYIQSSSGGMNIYSGSVASPLVRGNDYIVFGNVIQFNGLSEITFSSAANAIFDLGAATAPTPEVVTLATLLAAPESYEGKLVRVNTLSLAAGESDTWQSLATITLTDGALNIDARIPTGSAATTAPFYPISITGIFNQFDNSSPFDSGYQITPRDNDDVISSNPPFLTWAASAPYNLTGNDALFDADPDKDGVPNGIEFISGSNPTDASDAALSSPTLVIDGASGARNATITYRSTSISDYLNPVLQISDDLQAWQSVINNQNATISKDDNYYGPGIDRYTVIIDANATKGFVRLSAQSNN